MVSPLNVIADVFKKKNRGAFHGDMHCPYCSKHVDPTTTPMGFETETDKVKLNQYIGPFMREYRCGHCNSIWRYDIHRRMLHPYSSFKRGLKKNIRLPGMNYSGRVPLIK